MLSADCDSDSSRDYCVKTPSLDLAQSRTQHTAWTTRQLAAGGTGGYLVDELHVAREAVQGLLAHTGLPQEHGVVIRA